MDPKQSCWVYERHGGAKVGVRSRLLGFGVYGVVETVDHQRRSDGGCDCVWLRYVLYSGGDEHYM